MALSQCRMAPLRALDQRSSSYDKAHHFQFFFLERRVPICILLVVAYFLSIPASINRDWISKFSTVFYALKVTLSHTPKFLIFLIPIMIFSQASNFMF